MAGLIVILDEDLPGRAIDVLTSLGYDARSVRGLRWTGTKDPQLWPRVQAAGAFLVTADKGFADVRLYPPGTHGGILLLRPERQRIDHFIELIERVVKLYPLEQLVGTITIASERGVRIRRPPASDAGDGVTRPLAARGDRVTSRPTPAVAVSLPDAGRRPAAAAGVADGVRVRRSGVRCRVAGRDGRVVRCGRRGPTPVRAVGLPRW